MSLGTEQHSITEGKENQMTLSSTTVQTRETLRVLLFQSGVCPREGEAASPRWVCNLRCVRMLQMSVCVEKSITISDCDMEYTVRPKGGELGGRPTFTRAVVGNP